MPKQKEWEIQAYYPNSGWECVTTETSRKEAAQRYDEYVLNEPFTMFRIRYMGER
jgi:hypothetical protein